MILNERDRYIIWQKYVYLEDVLGGIVIERRKGCGFGEECEKGFPTNLPTNGLK